MSDCAIEQDVARFPDDLALSAFTPEDGDMPIKVQRRDGEARCAYCHDTVAPGVACPACGAVYHGECAQLFAVCAILGCTGELAEPGEAKVLPRVGALVTRMGSWDLDALLGEPEVVVLDPCERAVQESAPAAREVAALLGPDATAYDGRLRLQSRFPEPLAHFQRREDAQTACGRLRAERVPAWTLPLRELLRPLAPFPVAQARLEDPIILRNPTGEARLFPRRAPRLVVRGKAIEQRNTPRTQRIITSRGRAATRRRMSGDTAQKQEQVAFVFDAGEPEPAMIRPSKVRGVEAPGRPPLTISWRTAIDELAAGADVRELHGAAMPALLSLVEFGMASNKPMVRSNLLALQLLARMVRHRWEQERRQRAPERQGKPEISVRPRPRD